MTLRIVITGAPASGKTEVFNRLQSHPAFKEFVFFEELARRLLCENPYYREDQLAFHIEIYRRQAAREEAVADRPFITDRGTVDAFAFCREAMRRVGTTLEAEYRRYNAVIHLGSSAGLGDSYYRRDRIRNESALVALGIERAIAEVWVGHPCYHFIRAATDFKQKYSGCLQVLLSLLDSSRSGAS